MIGISFRIISLMIHSNWNSLYFIIFIIYLKIPKTENSIQWRICVSSHDSSLLFGHSIYWTTLNQLVFFSVIRYQRFNCLYWQHQAFIYRRRYGLHQRLVMILSFRLTLTKWNYNYFRINSLNTCYQQRKKPRDTSE